MIFIDTVNRLKQLPDHDDFTRFKRRRERPSDDSLTLSDAAAQVQHIVLSYETDVALTPTDSIIANLLETLLQQLDHQNIAIEALTRLAPQSTDWQVALQTPPIPPQASLSGAYVDTHKTTQKGTQPRTFEYRILGVNSSKTCHVTLIPRHLDAQLLRKFNTLAPVQTIQTPYEADQLSTLPDSWTFEIDQDGEPNPLETLYALENTAKVNYVASIVGLQIWFERQRDALPLLISDQRLGYVYIGNYEIFYHREESSERPIQALGDLDTSA